MSQYEQTNRGALFKNEGEKKRENGPDYSGNLNVGGKEFYLDAWIKVAQSGRKFMSVSVKPKQGGEGQRTHGQMKRGDSDNPPF